MEINAILTEGFEKWLKTLGYAESTVYVSTNYVRDFFFYLKLNEITNLEQIRPTTISTYHNYLQNRKNKRLSGGLSQNYITSNINALKRFSKYLQETRKPFFEVNTKTGTEKTNTKTILTKVEIHALYNACDNDILGIRDRAMLSIFYGCGLRRSEGLALDIEDILLKEKLLHVRKGKGNKERYVPITETIKDDLENYIYVARAKLQSFKPEKCQALFLSMRAKRLCGNALIERIHKLTKDANIQKDLPAGKARIGIHTLRHAIATHLLQSGMELEEVSRFLGHSSLESTQIYTHLSAETE